MYNRIVCDPRDTGASIKEAGGEALRLQPTQAGRGVEARTPLPACAPKKLPPEMAAMQKHIEPGLPQMLEADGKQRALE